MIMVSLSGPKSRIPLRNPASEAAGVVIIMHSTARTKSRLFQTFLAVSFVGKPSLNSSVPMLVSTLSGVITFAGIWVVILNLGVLAQLAAVKLTSTIKANRNVNNLFIFYLLSKFRVLGFETKVSVVSVQVSGYDLPDTRHLTPDLFIFSCYFTSSSSLGRQVLSNQGSSGPYIRRRMNQLLPGMV